MIIQIILVVFFLFALLKVLSRFRIGELKWTETLIWSLFWIVSILVVFNPNSTFILAKILGVGRGVDAVIYLSLVVLFFLVFRIFVHLEKIERNLTKLTRQDALKIKK